MLEKVLKTIIQRTTLNPKQKRKEIIQTTAEINEIEKTGNQ